MTYLRLGAVFLLCIVVLAACGLMSPQQQSDALAVVDEMLRNRSITPAQHEAMRESILSASSTNWWAAAAQTVLGGAMGYIGVQMKRGPVATPEERAKRKAVCR